MKRIINKQLILLTSCFLILLFTASSFVRHVTYPAAQDELAQAINNDRWDFSAEHAQPSYGRSRNIIGSSYYVQCRKDTLIVALPYYGKLNSPAGASNENPLDFKSTNFKLTKEKRKKGGWLVTIKSPNPEVQSMDFTFFDNGSAQATFIMTNRSGINFSGKVAAAK